MQEVIWSCWHFENAHAHPQWRKAHTCSECKKSFGHIGHLKGHMITHSKERAYACVQCQKSFGRATCLKRHRLTRSGVKAHSCSECERSFSQVGHLRRHMVTHTAQCVLCKVYFSAQLNKLRPILKFKKYYPMEHIFVSACSSARKMHFFKF